MLCIGQMMNVAIKVVYTFSNAVKREVRQIIDIVLPDKCYCTIR